jgi:hypothetical protein
VLVTTADGKAIPPSKQPSAPLLLPAASPVRPRQQQIRLAPLRGELGHTQQQQSDPAAIRAGWRKALNGGR